VQFSQNKKKKSTGLLETFIDFENVKTPEQL
jgi:hypothetical protein